MRPVPCWQQQLRCLSLQHVIGSYLNNVLTLCQRRPIEVYSIESFLISLCFIESVGNMCAIYDHVHVDQLIYAGTRSPRCLTL